MILHSNGYLEEYHQQMMDGRIIAGHELKQELSKLVEEMDVFATYGSNRYRWYSVNNFHRRIIGKIANIFCPSPNISIIR